jgi:hypothetical protein
VATTFDVPATWPTGLYVLQAGQSDVLSFVVLPAAPGATSTALLQISFFTPAAYNPAGGKSLYGYNSLPNHQEADRATTVSLDRPFDNGPPGLSLEAPLIAWLESEHLDVEYCSSLDLHADPQLLSSYDCLIVAGHDEYWTNAMRDQAERFVANGGNIIVLSGNTCFRAIRFDEKARMVVFVKYPENDPDQDNEEVTVAWADPPLCRPQNTLLGAGWTEGAFNGPASPYTVRLPSHWAFEGITSPTTTSAFMTYETDAAAYVDEPEGYPRVTGEEGTPLCYSVLASADLRAWSGKPGRATMGIFSRNGTVFNGGTTDWTGVLGSDPVVAQVTRNVFARLSRRVPWDWENIGQANGPSALASLGGRLYLATQDGVLWGRHPVGADVPWREIGDANEAVILAGGGETLFSLRSDNTLWWRPPGDDDASWTRIGVGPAGGTTALAVAGGMLYAADRAGALWRAPCARTAPTWSGMGFFQGDPAVTAMTSFSNILFAATADNRLLRSDRDWIDESAGWRHIHHCNLSTGLATIEWMLFVVTSEDLLWRIDLSGLRGPSAEVTG